MRATCLIHNINSVQYVHHKLEFYNLTVYAFIYESNKFKRNIIIYMRIPQYEYYVGLFTKIVTK
jgi:hypothetical protein